MVKNCESCHKDKLLWPSGKYSCTSLGLETCAITPGRKREQSTVMYMTVDCSAEELLEVCQEEPKEEPVYDIVLPNSTSYDNSIAGGGSVVIEQECQS